MRHEMERANRSTVIEATPTKARCHRCLDGMGWDGMGRANHDVCVSIGRYTPHHAHSLRLLGKDERFSLRLLNDDQDPAVAVESISGSILHRGGRFPAARLTTGKTRSPSVSKLKSRRNSESSMVRVSPVIQNIDAATASAVSMTGPNAGNSSRVATPATMTAAYRPVGRDSITSRLPFGSSSHIAFTTRL